VPPQKRDAVLWTLQDHNIGVAVNYRPIHLLKYYRDRFGYKEGDYPVAEDIGQRTISLPLYPTLREKDVMYIVKTLKKIL
jgi:dTDP-4-amino-4,6-dideoxygalactose transaminase